MSKRASRREMAQAAGHAQPRSAPTAAAGTVSGRITGGAAPVASAAAIHGFTEDVIATWSPYVVRRPRVLVPIHVDALVVRAAGGAWADCRLGQPSFSASDPQMSADLLAVPFKNLDATTEVPVMRARGVHLHWALPDALTRPDQTPPNSTDPHTTQLSATYPAIPDRWLVARIFPSPTSAKRAVKAWVLETGLPDPVQADLGTWTEKGWAAPPKNQPMTAFGYGDPAWAAYYDNVAGRLGFHDDLADVPRGPVAYLVCGWYANPVLDPLGKVPLNSHADFDNRMAALNWMLQRHDTSEALEAAASYVIAAHKLNLITEAAPPASAGAVNTSTGASSAPAQRLWPDQIVCHGAVVNVSWPDAPAQSGKGTGANGANGGTAASARAQLGEAGGPPSAAALTVSVGGTLPEAMAALIAARQGDDQQAHLLEAFHAHVLHELDTPDGLAKLDAALHATRFGSMPGGSVTETIQQSVPQHPPYVPPPGPPPHAGTGQGVREQGGHAVQGTGSTEAQNAARQPWINKPLAFTGGTAGAKSAAGEGIAGRHAGTFTEVVGSVREGNVAALAGILHQPEGKTTTYTTRTVEVQRALPRFFHPQDPVLLVEGGQRTFKHGYDDIHTDQGKLVCRTTGSYVTGLGVRVGDMWVPLQPEDVLDSGLNNGSLPMECEQLLRETVALDPGSAQALTAAAVEGASPTMTSPIQAGTFAQRIAVEQTAWHALRDPAVDPAPLVANSGLRGRLPSPIAITLAGAPWLPRHLDWEVEYVPSQKGPNDWTLDEIDYRPLVDALPPAAAPAVVTVSGRALVTGGAATSMAGAVRKALDDLRHAGTASVLAPDKTIWVRSAAAQRIQVRIAAATLAPVLGSATGAASSGGGSSGAEQGAAPDSQVKEAPASSGAPATSGGGDTATTGGSDGLGGTMGDASTDETGTASDSISAQDAQQLVGLATLLDSMDVLSGTLSSLRTQLRDKLAAQSGAAGTDLEAGFVRIKRLRLVDGYGQVVELGDTAGALKAGPLAVDSRPDLIALPPRFAGRSRLWVRFTKSDDGPDHHGDLKDLDVSPLCGFLMPNHLDSALTFYDAAGQIMGNILPQWAEDSTDKLPVRLVWEDAPGRPATVGAPPSRALPNVWLGGIADALLAWGRTATPDVSEHAVSAMLRVIDSTRWTVDPFGHTGEEHLALLVGHPVAVLRARIRLEVEDYAPTPPATGSAGVTTAPGGVDANWAPSRANTAVPLRLGALTHWQDGLFGYFVNDDYTTLYCVDAAAADFARPIGPMQGFLQAVGSAAVTYSDWTTDLGPDPDSSSGTPSSPSPSPSPGNTPVRHPYINTSGVVYIQPNQDVWVTLLVEPHTLVHATAGLLPRKDLAVRREWVQDGLANLAPAFRFGPVLVDPKTVRMPVPSDLQGAWSWDHRENVSSWQNDPVTNASDQALLAPDPSSATEGWLQLVPPAAPQNLSLQKSPGTPSGH